MRREESRRFERKVIAAKYAHGKDRYFIYLPIEIVSSLGLDRFPNRAVFVVSTANLTHKPVVIIDSLARYEQWERNSVCKEILGLIDELLKLRQRARDLSYERPINLTVLRLIDERIYEIISSIERLRKSEKRDELRKIGVGFATTEVGVLDLVSMIEKEDWIESTQFIIDSVEEMTHLEKEIRTRVEELADLHREEKITFKDYEKVKLVYEGELNSLRGMLLRLDQILRERA